MRQFLTRPTLSRVAAGLIAASLVASCQPGGGALPTQTAAGRNEAGIERVVLQAYRAIGDRALREPDFRKLSLETYRGFATQDPSMSLVTADGAYTVMRDGKAVISRTPPSNPTDGRAWGNMMADLFTGSIKASPALQQVDRQVLIKGAMDATTKQLDRNTRYADPEEARDDRFQRDGGGGIGITVERMPDKKVVIRAVQADSPSGRAGVQPDDQILAIDGENMVDRPLADVVHKLRGTVGAPVSLTVLRPSQGRELTVAMKRSRIIPTTVEYERHGDVALIRLKGFNSATDESLHQAIDKARGEIGRDFAGFIIDMRGNRGGLLDQAQDVAEEFIGDGPIFSTQGRHPDSHRVYRSSSRRAVTQPIVVLVNGNSASAAEIVAAALQDRGRAVVVGTTSYGKGTVQTVLRMPNEGELILTWSRLVAPSGYTWNELGVMPNICTAKVTDVNKLGPELDASRALLTRWHAEREPSPQEVASMRKICPPGEDTPERDVEVASRMLRDPVLYAQAVKSGAVDQAARQ
ncbi:MAG: PDZ domain-containing protein [Proteobacteria bacterium]|nr:PDZ domain-containing protein [Pseudomonadota bacterium]